MIKDVHCEIDDDGDDDDDDNEMWMFGCYKIYKVSTKHVLRIRMRLGCTPAYLWRGSTFKRGCK